MKPNQEFFIPRHINYEGLGLVNKATIDTEVMVIDSNGKEVQHIVHNGQKYIPCNIGDSIIYRYIKKNFSRTFKVKSIDPTEQFFICEPVYSKEELVEMQLKELKMLVEEGNISPNKAHLKADELLMELLYKLELDRVADAFIAIPKFYN